MMEVESVASIWASISTWFTPTILFIFLNLMIATILFTSNLPQPTTTHPKPHNPNQDPTPKPPPNQPKLPRSPSILHRLKSLSLYPLHTSQSQPYSHESDPPLQADTATHYVFNFNHPFAHDHDLPVSPNPNTPDLVPVPQPVSPNPDLHSTRFLSESDSNHTNEVLQVPNAETFFVFDNHTVETVTTHFDFGPDPVEEKTRPYENETNGKSHKTRPDENDSGNDELKSLDEVYSKITGGHMDRTKSDTAPASGEVAVKLPAKMKKSASMKSAFSHFEEEKIVEARRPATVRETKEGDVEVDAKADDFINKFKHQLKLQRLDSIVRYKDMVNRGGGK